MADPPPGEQRFDFGADRPAAALEDDQTPTPAEQLIARVDAVHAAATRRSRRRTTARDRSIEPALFSTEEVAQATGVAVVTVLHEEGAVSDEELPGELEDTLSIAQFYRRIRRALESEFPDEVWVTGEIRGLRVRSGHHYIELADQGSETTGRSAQQLEVACWARDWPPIGAALAAAGVELEVGRVVRVRGRVSIWEGGGRLRFTLTALDVEALLGGIAAARRQLLLSLEAEGLLEANRRLAVPLVPLRIGVVTSPGSEAHRDFVGQLERSGYNFEVRLEGSLVQGTEAPNQIAAALRRLEAFAPDLAVLVRGGGARGDLAAFDSPAVAYAIVLAPFPVWCGVGHTGDRSVADEVANFAAITPTACGEAVVARVAAFYDELRGLVRQLSALATTRLATASSQLAGRARRLNDVTRRHVELRQLQLVNARQTLRHGTLRQLDTRQATLQRRAHELAAALARSLSAQRSRLEHGRQLLAAYDPERQLQRGWSLTRDGEGRLLRSVEGIAEGATISTRLADGELVARVESTTRRARE